MTTSEAILKWLEENKDWFKPTSIAKKLKIDRGNFSRYMKSEIPEKHLISIMEIIVPLGFTLDELVTKNNTPEVKEEIMDKRNGVNETTKVENPLSESEMVNPETIERIAKIEEMLKMPPKFLSSLKRNQLESELNKLKFKLIDNQ